MCAIVGMENYRKNINQYPFIVQLLGILLICHITFVSGQCKNGVVNVASCPSSDYAWSVRANEFCTQKEQYHCLITENYNQNDMDIIECCMEPHNITKGHMPRYSRSKNTIQEIECTGEYYMPVQFPSNKFRLYGVENCMYKKFMCNMSGMKVCSEGSKVSDRTCHCDYKNLYVAYLPLSNGDPCFMKDDNECVRRDGCSKPNQELNMYYKCVNVCAEGYYRPEMTADCRPFSPTTTPSATEHVSLSTVTASTRVPVSVGDDNNKTVNTAGGMDDKFYPVIAIIVVCVLGIFIVVTVIYKSYKHKPNLEVPHVVEYTQEEECCNIKCVEHKGSALYTVEKYQWFKRKMQPSEKDEALTTESNSNSIESPPEAKYLLADEDQDPSLLIFDLQEEDQALYRCVIYYRFLLLPITFVGVSKYVSVRKKGSPNEFYNFKAKNIIVGDHGRIEDNRTIENTKTNNEMESESFLKENQRSGTNQDIEIDPAYYVTEGGKAIIKVCIKKEISKIVWFKYQQENWKNPEKVIIDNKKYMRGDKWYSSLIIGKATLEDEMHYFCSVKFKDKEGSVDSLHTYLVVNKDNNSLKIPDGGTFNYTVIEEVGTYYNGDKEERIPVSGTIQPTAQLPVKTIQALSKASDSVGYLHGPIETGTCWRVGRDKIITAFHVVRNNIWDNANNRMNELLLKRLYIDFNFVEKKSRETIKVEDKLVFFDEELDVAILQLKTNSESLPPAFTKFIDLDASKHQSDEIFLISHNKGQDKNLNHGIGLWQPTEEKMERLKQICEELEQDYGYKDLDPKERLVIKCDFIVGASGSPGIVINNDNKPKVAFIYLRGFPTFYYSRQCPEETKKKIPQECILQQGVSVFLVHKQIKRKNLDLLKEIFPEDCELDPEVMPEACQVPPRSTDDITINMGQGDGMEGLPRSGNTVETSL